MSILDFFVFVNKIKCFWEKSASVEV